MKQPEGFIETNSENKVCKLNKSILDLKQAAIAWHTKIAESLKIMNFAQRTADTCLFTRKKKEYFTYIIVYIDDILIASKK